MISTTNNNRFLRSIKQCHWGNPQPTKAFMNRIRNRIWPQLKPKVKVRFSKIQILKSNPFWRGA